MERKLQISGSSGILQNNYMLRMSILEKQLQHLRSQIIF